MNLIFNGKGSAFYPIYGNTSAYFIYKDALYVIDCGESVFEKLYKTIDFDNINHVYALITHLHADHVGSLGTLISYCYCVKNKIVTIIHPEKTILEMLKLGGVPQEGYVYLSDMPENKYNLKVRPVEVVHAKDMKCYGYVLTDAVESIYYSGDSSDIPEEILRDFLAGNIQRIYQDTSTHDSPNPSHCYYGKLEEKIPKELRSRVYCMHLDSPCEELLMEKGFNVVK